MGSDNGGCDPQLRVTLVRDGSAAGLRSYRIPKGREMSDWHGQHAEWAICRHCGKEILRWSGMAWQTAGTSKGLFGINPIRCANGEAPAGRIALHEAA